MLRRLCSTVPPSRAGLTPKPTPTSRGRTKPLRPTRSTPSPSTTTRVSLTARHRKPRSGLSSTSSTSTKAAASIEHEGQTSIMRGYLVPESGKGFTFSPVRVYPKQMGYHLSFLPRHLPLPLHLGTGIYTNPPQPSVEATMSSSDDELDMGPFSAPPQPSLSDLIAPFSSSSASASPSTSSQSGVSEHLHLLNTLSSQPQHLGGPSLFTSSTTAGDEMYDGLERDYHLSRVLGTSLLQNRMEMDNTWQKVISTLSSPSSPFTANQTQAQEVGSTKSEIDQAVTSLSDLLKQMAKKETKGRKRPPFAVVLQSLQKAGKDSEIRDTKVSMEEERVELDSTVRKRKKKINKHKYKKRRKATRAQRKRLGK